MNRLVIGAIIACALLFGGKAHAQAWHGFKQCTAFSNGNSFTAPGLGTTWQPWSDLTGVAPSMCLDGSGHAYVFAKGPGGVMKWIDTHGVYGWAGTLGGYPTFTSCGYWSYHTVFNIPGYGYYSPYTSLTGIPPTACIGDYGTFWVMSQDQNGAFKWAQTDDSFGIGN